jgi:hypothetical protein
MNPKDAIQNMKNLLKAALKSGMFGEVEAVFAMQASIEVLEALVNGTAKMDTLTPPNGMVKEKELVTN